MIRLILGKDSMWTELWIWQCCASGFSEHGL